jgi:hypothetical protein
MKQFFLNALSLAMTREHLCCNVPRVTSIEGYAIRSQFKAGDGFMQMAFDFASLEARVQANFCLNYTDGVNLARDLLAEKPNSIHCFSEDTQILTSTGWKTFDQVTTDCLVAQWLDGVISFVKPSNVIWRRHTGKMINIKSARTDQLVTPEHRVVSRLPNSTNWSVTTANNFTKRSSARVIPNTGILTQEDNSEYSDNFLKLAVAVQADAYLLKDCSGIKFSFSKERKVQRLKDILDNLGITYTHTTTYPKDRETSYHFYLNSSEDTVKIRNFLSLDKSLTDNLLTLSSRQMNLVLDEIQFWDGTVTRNSDVVLDTTSIKTAKTIQTLCHLTNRAGHFNKFVKSTVKGICTIYRCYISNNKSNLTVNKNYYSEVDYDGFVGCVTVPSSFVVVKRSDKIFVSGNCINARKLGITRDAAKSFTYAVLYGAQATKLMKMLSISAEEAQRLYDLFWESVPALKELKDKVEQEWMDSGQQYIVGIDGRKLMSRSKHSLLNLLFQGTGAAMAKLSTVLICQELEELDLLGNPLVHNKSDYKIYQMIAYHNSLWLYIVIYIE